jgi:hypothetical protein
VAGFYETWLSSPGLGPNWIHDPVGNAYWATVGKVMDQQVQRMQIAVRCHFPMDALKAGMSDALDEIGKDRLLPRGGTTPGGTDESEASLAARLVNAWETWKMAGTPRGLLLALKTAGFPTGGTTGTVIINHIGIMYALDGSDNLVVSRGTCAECLNRTDLTGTIPATKLKGFTLDVRDQFYSHFVILFRQAISGLDNTAGNVVKACLNRTVALWRCGGAIYNGAAVVPTGARVWDWPPTDKWDDEGLVWGDNGATWIDSF